MQWWCVLARIVRACGVCALPGRSLPIPRGCELTVPGQLTA
jgi:hypothetical protein